MDPIALIFYATVCGCLGGFAPALSSAPIRIGVGAVVGILAALALPFFKGMMGY